MNFGKKILSIILLLILGSLDLYGKCEGPSMSDPDSSDHENRKVRCLAGENFSCWDNNSASTKFPIGKRICAIFSGAQGSWYNEVPLVLESDLVKLDRNDFEFTEKNYKSWKKYLTEKNYDHLFKDPDPNDHENRKVGELCGEKFSCWDNNSAATKFPIGVRICSIFSGVQGSWYNNVPLLRESDLISLNQNGFKFTEKNYKSWKYHLKSSDKDNSVNGSK